MMINIFLEAIQVILIEFETIYSKMAYNFISVRVKITIFEQENNISKVF